MKKAIALRHLAFEDLGNLAPLLPNGISPSSTPKRRPSNSPTWKRWTPICWSFSAGPSAFTTRRTIRSSNPKSASSGAGWKRPGRRWAFVWDASSWPMPSAPGSIRREPRKSRWSPLQLTAEGRTSCLAPLGESDTPVLHWHGDTFDLPAGAVHLAATDVCTHQAFRVGYHALALQFHLEATAIGLESWYVGHTGEIAATAGVSVGELRAGTRRWAGALAPRANAVFNGWLDEAGL